jgi:pimeloyl-ACP methyl ester carboxylesterase
MAARVRMVAIAAALAISVSAAAAPVALAADPAIAVPPAAMAAMQIASGDGAMNAIVYTPGSAGPHPAMILFHGQPGNEQNLDLAQAARRAGFVVLTLHYRGSWASPGVFSYANATQDGINAIDWMLAPEQRANFQIDPNALVVAGHSVGGFVAARATAARPAVKGLLLLDAWDVDEANLTKLRAPGGRDAYIARQGNGLDMLATTPAKLADEMLASGGSFDLRREASALATRPVLIIAAEKANGKSNRGIAASLQSAGNSRVNFILMPTDHGFNDHRIALITASLDWLQQFGGKP